jgi:hypothetical protein
MVDYSAVKECTQWISTKLWETLTSIYFYANVLYVVYSVGIYRISFSGLSTAEENRYYLIYGIIHVISAFLYTISWYGFKNWNELVILPDYLNIVGSALWLWAAVLYPHMYSSSDDNLSYTYNYGTITVNENCTIVENPPMDLSVSNDFTHSYYQVRAIELSAASIEVVCGFLW